MRARDAAPNAGAGRSAECGRGTQSGMSVAARILSWLGGAAGECCGAVMIGFGSRIASSLVVAHPPAADLARLDEAPHREHDLRERRLRPEQ
eukprot:7377976-Prymnesium_polylepis.1